MNLHQRAAAEDIFRGAPPHNIEAEQGLLGAIFNNNEALAAVGALIDEEDFFEPIHKEIFQICRGLIETGQVASPITVKTFLATDRNVGNLTVSQYLARLAAEATTVVNAPDYARIVRDLCIRRHLIAAAEDCAIAAKTAAVDEPAKQIATATTRRIEKIIAGRTSVGSDNGGYARPLTAAEFLKLDLPPRKKIISPWLPEKGLVMIYSPRGVGKTLIGMTRVCTQIAY